MRKFILSTILCLAIGGWTFLSAQEQFSDPQSRFITNIPFRQLNGGVIILRANLASHPDTLNFILDTGSGGISLDSSTCEELHIVPTESDRTIRVIGGIKNVSFVYNESLLLPGLKVDSLNFHVNDYGLLTTVYGLRIDGIIGYSFISRYILRINYDSSRIEVFTPGEFKYPRGGYVLHPTIGSIPVQQLRLKDSRSFVNRFYFDTGAGLCLLLSEDFVHDSTVLGRKRRKPVITQAEGLGGKMQMRLTTVKELRLGPYRFRHVPTYIFDDKYNVTSYPSLGGLFGNDLLRRFNIILNYRIREIHIIPNSHFTDLFDYSYSGLGIYFVDGRVVVEDVIPESPAEEAGFKVGDVILSINNNFSNNILTYKSMLQTTGERLKFVILREGSPDIIQMKPKSIL